MGSYTVVLLTSTKSRRPLMISCRIRSVSETRGPFFEISIFASSQLPKLSVKNDLILLFPSSL